MSDERNRLLLLLAGMVALLYVDLRIAGRILERLTPLLWPQPEQEGPA